MNATMNASAVGARRILLMIPSYNGAKWIERCINSVLTDSARPAQMKILVVDNASQDDTRNLIAGKFPGIEIIRNSRNIGFAKACNIGFMRGFSDGMDYVVLLNQDTHVRDGWLRELVAAADREPGYGVLSPLQYDYEGKGIDPVFSRLYSRGIAQGSIVETVSVVGAAMLVRRGIFEKVGFFDPMYFCYGEEDDFCRRVRYHGFKIGVVPGAVICHWHTFVQTGGKDRLQGLRLRNTMLLELKDPRHGSARRLFQYVRYTVLPFLRAAAARRDPQRFWRIVWINLGLLIHLPRILTNRNAERRGACHL